MEFRGWVKGSRLGMSRLVDIRAPRKTINGSSAKRGVFGSSQCRGKARDRLIDM